MLRLLQTILACNGAKSIQSVHDGQAALAAMRSRPPDMMIAEWIMTPMDGLELTRYIRRSDKSPNPHLPIILMTGIGDGNLSLAIDAGVSEILQKPIHAKALVESIQTLSRPHPVFSLGVGVP
jgi:PleD family two-component response regulator